ncbi:hypothetical protein RvY_08278-2 [Ramazzottius varieornatus]|uniref:Uncharacterized protein n=1 Tax=Ramazzottius varieornatus TaxID=947166 RepID=A0A1D1VEG4_RAMVA|nr:hypothetical protein RvY_08278-2 [Ramazzottius varieornatus]
MHITKRTAFHRSSLAFLNLCLHGEFVFHFFEEYAVNRIKNYPNGFARTLRDWNKPPVENQRSRRPACIDPAIFKSVIEPLINDVLHPAKHNDFQLLHGKYFSRETNEHFTMQKESSDASVAEKWPVPLHLLSVLTTLWPNG